MVQQVHYYSYMKMYRVLKGELQSEQPTPAVVRDSVAGMVARGSRPSHLAFNAPWRNDAPLAEARVLAVLGALASAGSVTFAGFYLHTPITSAIAAALAGVSPKLDAVCLMHGTECFGPESALGPEHTPPPPAPAEVESAAAGVLDLVRLVGPRLRTLTVCMDAAERYIPQMTIPSLALCTALRSLSLQLPPLPKEQGPEQGLLAELQALNTISSMSSLRHLDLWGGGAWVPPTGSRPLVAAPLTEYLSCLTGLTSLRLDLRRLRHYGSNVDRDSTDDSVSLSWQLYNASTQGAALLRAAAAAEWRAVASALRCMPGLAELRTPLQADLADITALTALTCLRVGALVLPNEAAEAAAAIGGERLTFVLPPLLRRLETHAPLPMRVAAALQPAAPPPGQEPCTLLASGRLSGWDNFPWCLHFGASDLNEDTISLTGAGAAVVKGAVSALGKFAIREPQTFARGVRVIGDLHSRFGVRPPPPADDDPFMRSGTHVASWMGELEALRLQWLSLSNLALSPRDMLALARRHTSLTGLDLRGSCYSVGALSQLAGMQRLRTLVVNLHDWTGADGLSLLDLIDPIESAFLSLTQTGASQQQHGEGEAGPGLRGCGHACPLPELRLLSVGCPEGQLELMGSLVAPARLELARRGNGAELELRQCYGIW